MSDRGLGFDLPEAIKGHGLGLVSMRERLQAVGGELSIDSRPGEGTTVTARILLTPQDEEAGALKAAG